MEIIRGVVGRRKARQGIATHLVSKFAERSVRQLAATYAKRGAFSERTNEIAAV